jgi:hypothetical protein
MGKHYSNLGTSCVNQIGRTLVYMLLEGANYVQDFLDLFSKIEQYHGRKMCLKEYFICKLENGMET